MSDLADLHTEPSPPVGGDVNLPVEPADTTAGEADAAQTQTIELPVELPELLQGLEGFVYNRAARLADPRDPVRFKRAVRLVIAEVEHNMKSPDALGQIATNMG